MQDRSTDFEFLPIDVSLGRCQRYAEIITGTPQAPAVVGESNAGNVQSIQASFATTKRTDATLSINSGTYFQYFNGATWVDMTTYFLYANKEMWQFAGNSGSNTNKIFRSNGTILIATAEL